MIKSKNIEMVYDYLDQVALALYEAKKIPYLKGVSYAVELLMTKELEIEIDEELMNTLLGYEAQLENQTFEKEEVRKAFQLCILKGYKHIKAGNQDMTPDTIGIFISYLMNKFFTKEEDVILFDPLVGTGNLITCVANHLESKETTLVGVDDNIDQFLLAKAMFDMMDYGEQLYYQDSLNFWNLEADAIVTDFSYHEDEEVYFPYEVILHHEENLKKGGYFFAVIYNDFFEKKGSDVFRKEVLESYDILGLIKLPDSIFKHLGKSILILQKKETEPKENKQFLLADIPSFEDETTFNNAIQKINQWFDNQKIS